MSAPEFNKVAALILGQLRAFGFDETAISLECSFEALGVDSLSVMEILVAIEKSLGVKISLSELTPEAMSSVGSFARFVCAAGK